jgi:hypothetical protein
MPMTGAVFGGAVDTAIAETPDGRPIMTWLTSDYRSMVRGQQSDNC